MSVPIAITPERFLQQFLLDGSLLCVATGKLSDPNGWAFLSTLKQPLPTEDVFFTPAQRKTPGNNKTDVYGTKYLWVDIDNSVMPDSIIPPTMVVWSGHGWHFYWRLTKPITDVRTIEVLNRILAYAIPTSDKGCWNANRFMRVPGTTNTKSPPAAVEYRFESNVAIDPEDVRVIPLITEKCRNRILTGNSQGYKSRSERDWAVVLELLQAKATDAFIHRLYRWHAIGEKLDEKGQNGTQYLQATIDKAKQHLIEREAEDTPKGTKADKGDKLPAGLVAEADGYYTNGTTPRRVSTFTITPKVLLDGSDFGYEDAIVGDVQANGRTWTDKTFTRSAFTSVPKMFKECLEAEWQWLGNDSDVRLLLPHLIEQLETTGTRVKASPTLGLHIIDGKALFLGDAQTLSSERLWKGAEGPLAWLPRHKDHWQLDLEPNVLEEDLAIFARELPRLNQPECIWTVIGWYAAAPLKEWLKERGWRYPVLHLTGTRGAGKSSLLLYTMHPLFAGLVKAKDYGADTTRFVTLSLMGGSNGIPVAFSEFRYETVSKLQHYIRLAYDSGHDPRGKADQSIVDYALSAPFSVDGEDMITDAAIQERIAIVRMKPATVAEGTPAYYAYQALKKRINAHEREEAGLSKLGFAGYYLQQLLAKVDSGEVKRLLSEARREIIEAYPGRLPDRVRNNYTVVNLGIKLACQALRLSPPPASVLNDSIKQLVNLETGRGRTMVDDFIEDIVSYLHDSPSSSNYFKWTYESVGNTVYIHIKSAHAWWLQQRRRQGRTGLELEAIKAQLKETSYILEPIVYEGAWLQGISLTGAVEVGLDLPDKLPEVKEMRIRG